MFRERSLYHCSCGSFHVFNGCGNEVVHFTDRNGKVHVMKRIFASQNRVLRETFGPEKIKVAGKEIVIGPIDWINDLVGKLQPKSGKLLSFGNNVRLRIRLEIETVESRALNRAQVIRPAPNGGSGEQE